MVTVETRRRAVWAVVAATSTAAAFVAWSAAPDDTAASSLAALPAERILGAASSIARWLLIALSLYLATVAVLQVVSRRDGGALARLAASLTPRVAAAMVTVVVGTTVPAMAGATGADTTASSPPTMRRTEPAPQTWLPWTSTGPAGATSADRSTAPADDPGVVVADGSTSSTGVAEAVPLGPAEPVPPTVTDSAPEVPASAIGVRRLHVVERGEHLWSIAEQELERRLGAPTGSLDEASVASYWVQLVEHNRHRLVDPDNPDLIHAGLEIELP